MTRHDSRPSGPVPIGTCIMVFPLLHVIDNKNDKKLSKSKAFYNN